jgi:signal peptidase I
LTALTVKWAAGLLLSGLGLVGFLILAKRYLLHVTVHGDSMAPDFQHGDGLLVLRSPPATVRRGRVVVGLIPEEHTDPDALAAGWPPHFVKHVVGVGGDRVEGADGTDLTVPAGAYYVRGQAQYSMDSRVWGPVDRTRIIGVVLRRLGRRADRPHDRQGTDSS